MGMDEMLARYTPDDRRVILRFMDKLAALTRGTGKISEAKKMKIIASFAGFDPDVVIASLNAYLNMMIPTSTGGKGKNEKYVCGIMANKQAEKDGRGGGDGETKGRAGDCGGKAGKCADGMAGDEGARLQRLAESTSGGQLECDF